MLLVWKNDASREEAAGAADRLDVGAEVCELWTLMLFSTKLLNVADIGELMGEATEIPAAGDWFIWVENALGVTLGSLAADRAIG